MLIPNPMKSTVFGDKGGAKLSKKLIIPPEDYATPKKSEIEIRTPSQFALMKARSDTPKS